MQIKQCECCKHFTMRLYNADSYNDRYRYVCSSCLLELVKAFSFPIHADEIKHKTAEESHTDGSDIAPHIAK
ncbi:MAG: hypothetical protein HZC28_12770 [Spirochaetes bacterium]|nr:hypothetical protein [Spirochaetota bacterium]